MRKLLLVLLVAMASETGCPTHLARAHTTILVDCGPFSAPEAAAAGERQVNWRDDDLADDTACTECFAATELRHFLAVCTGRPEAEIQLAAPDKLPGQGDVVLLGSGEANPLLASLWQTAGKGSGPASPEAFHVVAVREGARTITIIRGGGRVGTLYGAYAYLERLGMRFYGLGERDTLAPNHIAGLPCPLDFGEEPDYLTRGFFVFEDRGDLPFFLWMARNRLNLWSALSEAQVPLLKKVGMKLAAGWHDIQLRCLDPQRYFQSHPEWYGLRNGKRSARVTDGAGDNYCTSNAEATAELARNLVSECVDGLWKDADLINFWMMDNGIWCECDSCREQGSFTDRLLLVMHASAQALKAARAEGRLGRNVQLVSLAYHETLPAPTRPLPVDFDYANCLITAFPIERCYVHTLADPACTEINAALCKSLEGWTSLPERHYRGALVIGEYYNVSSFMSLPLLFSQSMAADIPWYYQIGARHFHYMHVPTQLWGTWRLNQYLIGRLTWNVRADVASILDEYFARTYPTTSAKTRDFYRELERASSNFKAFKHYVGVGSTFYTLRSRLGSGELPIFPLDHLHYERHTPPQNDGPDVVEIVEAMSRARRALDDALLECGDAGELARLTEDERRFAYCEATVRLYYHLVRTALFHRRGAADQARREFAAVEREASLLRTVVDLVQVSSTHANAADGLQATQAAPAYEFYQKLYAAAPAQP